SEMERLYLAWKTQSCTSPFIILTNCQSGLQRARLLEKGVSHYFIQPCSYSRLATLIIQQEYATQTVPEEVLTSTHFSVDVLRRTVVSRGSRIPFTRIEFDIFTFLMRYQGLVLSRVQIWEE